jgi:hypothetical protein
VLASLACTGALPNLASALDNSGGAAYLLRDSSQGTRLGANPAQRFTLKFNNREAWLSHPRGGIAFRLAGYGYADRLRKPEDVSPIGAGNRVEYRRGDLTEWYVNGPQGLEQGFTFAHWRRWRAGRRIRQVRVGKRRSGVVWSRQQELGPPNGRAQYQFGKSVSVSGSTVVIGAYGYNNFAGAAYVFVDGGGKWSHQKTLTNTDAQSFGSSVSISGDSALIGGWFGPAGVDTGAAYVFVRKGTKWRQQQELTASDGAAGDAFGIAVSLSGDTALVGAQDHTVNGQVEEGPPTCFSAAWRRRSRLPRSHFCQRPAK